MLAELADSVYRRDLGGGLVLRWSSVDDADRVGELLGTIWRNDSDPPVNPRMAEVARRHLAGGYPLVRPGDCALVEATEQPGRPIVACCFLWREEWSYEGIRFTVGRPENIVTNPAYRNRGLVRAMIELVHARSATEGHPVLAITGIPYFYRQFGYEYALDLHGRRIVYTALIPPAPADASAPYTLRPATGADIARIAELYARRRGGSILWNELGERYWRYLIEFWGPPEAPRDPIAVGAGERLLAIDEAGGAMRGFAMVAAKRWGNDLQVHAIELDPDVSLATAAPDLLRALHQYGAQLPTILPNPQPLREISLMLGREHPLHAVLAPALAPVVEPPYAWYMRVPSLPAFLRLIAPALEQRLAASPAAGYSGALTTSFYRGGLRWTFDGGRLAAIEPWDTPSYQESADASIPALVFLQLLFGYRSLADLRYANPDISANATAALLLNALFPARPSWVLAL